VIRHYRYILDISSILPLTNSDYFNISIQLLVLTVENRDFFEPDGSRKLCEIIAYHMDNIEKESKSSIQIISAGLSLARCASKAENNKGQLMRYSMGEIVNKLLTMHRPQDEDSWDDVKKNACFVLRGLSVHDDYRKDMSSAHDNGRLAILPLVAKSMRYCSKENASVLNRMFSL
jgi:hypothetical protein